MYYKKRQREKIAKDRKERKQLQRALKVHRVILHYQEAYLLYHHVPIMVEYHEGYYYLDSRRKKHREKEIERETEILWARIQEHVSPTPHD